MTDDFSAFGLPPKILQSLARMQYTTPTPIQSQALPLALAGRDILGSAQTGTGKTAAFGIPLIVGLMNDPQATALVLTPTRELAAQVMAHLQQLIPVPTIRTALLIGGEAMPKQFRQLQGHARLVVGTPGRINDHLERGTLKLKHVRYLVLDETDRMLDMGFGIQIDRIVAHVPRERQTMLFSATLPHGIVKLSAKYLKDPERVSVGSMTTAAPNIEQETIYLSDDEKLPRLFDLLKGSQDTTIIFVKTKYGAEKLAIKLSKQKVKADAIHGDLRQSRRDRVIQGFRDKKFQVLVATDLAARGLDVPHIKVVINYDLPQCPEDYIHRIGRTARAGAVGKAINLVTPRDKVKWGAINKLMNPNAPRIPRDADQRNEDSSRHRRPFHKKFGNPKRRDDRPHGEHGDRPHARPQGERAERPAHADSRHAPHAGHSGHGPHAGKPAHAGQGHRDHDNRPTIGKYIPR